jgi:DegV family protein with EDD domain
MTIRIVTDSTSDLPPDVAQAYGITVIPAYINFDGKSLKDGIEISHQQYYEMLPGCNPLPQTSSPSLTDFSQVYERLTQEGATEILSIHVAGAYSSVVDNASVAAAQSHSVPVTVVDSRSVTMGMGLLVIEAAKAVESGGAMPDVLAMLEQKIPRTYIYAALETMDYLRRGGRISHLQHSVASLLGIHPVVILNNSILHLELFRLRKKAVERILELGCGIEPPEQVAVMHANAPERAAELYQQVKAICGKDAYIGEANPALGTHVGPGAVGVICIKKTAAPDHHPGSPLGAIFRKITSLAGKD